VLELVGEAAVDVGERSRRAVAGRGGGRRGGEAVVLLLGGGEVVVEVSLVADPTGGLARAPDVLVAAGVGERLREGGGGGGEGAALLRGVVGGWVVKAEVQMKAVGVAVVGLLLLLLLLVLLLLVGHGGSGRDGERVGGGGRISRVHGQ